MVLLFTFGVDVVWGCGMGVLGCTQGLWWYKGKGLWVDEVGVGVDKEMTWLGQQVIA